MDHYSLPLEGWLKKTIIWLSLALILTGCGRLDSIPYSPTQTPESWLMIQPYAEFPFGTSVIRLVQPSTSAIVYFLGLLTIGAGLYFLHIQGGQRSRRWWGIALLLWGLGALLAGTSYEAFSYQIKCAGRAVCIWTSWWEIGYLIVSVASVDAMLVAQAYACASGKLRRTLIAYAQTHFVLYILAVLIGSSVPIQFLISFEFLLVVSTPAILFFIALNGWRFARFKQRMDLALLGTWGWLILTIAAYFGYYLSGLTHRLWAQGYWFSENDVLHIGLILWMCYIATILARVLLDSENSVLEIPPVSLNSEPQPHSRG